MGIAKLKITKLMGLGLGMDTKLMAATLAALPDKTQFVGVETSDLFFKLLFENPVFRDGAELEATYHRDVALIGDEVVEIDHFKGINLNECLLHEVKSSGNSDT